MVRFATQQGIIKSALPTEAVSGTGGAQAPTCTLCFIDGATQTASKAEEVPSEAPSAERWRQ